MKKHGLDLRQRETSQSKPNCDGLKALITVPSRQHWYHEQVGRVLLLLSMDGRYRTDIRTPSYRPFENALHHCVRILLDEGFDFWLSIDSDNPPMNNPLDLVELDRDIIGLPTPIWHYTKEKPGERPYYWNAYDYVPEDDAYKEHVPQEGLQKVDAVGTGCFLMARRVFEDLEMQKAPFERKLYPDGRVHKGNDMSFCEKVRARGFEVWAHYGYPCHHFVEIDLLEMIRALQGMK